MQSGYTHHEVVDARVGRLSISLCSQNNPQRGPQPARSTSMESLPSLSRIADAALHPCKICATPSPLFGVVDFHKSCIETTGHGLPLSGIPIYYRRCPRCAFSFTTAFDDWPTAAFLEHIYNADYLHIDPDYAERRPTNNARFIAETFQATRSTIQILDYGGGNGILAQRLRDQHFNATTYDPFSLENQLPTHRFDLITCFEVLEHVPNPRTTMDRIHSLLTDQGAILFSTLLQPESFDRIGLTWWYAAPRNGHVSLYSQQSLALLFTPHNMQVHSLSENLHIARHTEQTHSHPTNGRATAKRVYPSRSDRRPRRDPVREDTP